MVTTIEISIVWKDEDIRELAQEMGVCLTGEQVGEIIDRLQDTHDAERGITWELIREEIRYAKATEVAKMLPCPFCGSEAELSQQSDHMWVWCLKCRCNPGHATSRYSKDETMRKIEAIRLWNRRASHNV